MEMKLNLWIAEQNLKHACELKRYLEPKEEITKIRVFSRGKRIRQLLVEEMPDMVILDAELEDMNGFVLLWEIRKEYGEIPFPFMIVSSISEESMIRQAVELGACYYLLRPCVPESIYHRVLKYTQYDRNEKMFYQRQYIRNNLKRETDNSLEQEVTRMIRELGIPAHIKGYQYIRESIIMAVKDGSILNYITKMLYPAIAKKYRTTSSSVERAIRHAIEVAFSRGQAEYLEELFGYRAQSGRGKPTNSEFIALIADKMKLEYKLHP